MLVAVIAMHCAYYLSLSTPKKLYCTNPAMDSREVTFQVQNIDTLESQRYDFVPKIDHDTIQAAGQEGKQEMMGCRVTFQGKSHSVMDLDQQVFFELPCSELRKKLRDRD